MYDFEREQKDLGLLSFDISASILWYHRVVCYVCGARQSMSCVVHLNCQTFPTCLTGTQSNCLCYWWPPTGQKETWVLLLSTHPPYLALTTPTHTLLWPRPLTQVVNQVVLWDKIIRRGDSPIVKLHKANNKYRFFDDGRGLLW